MGPLIRSGLYAGDKANEALTSGISFPKAYCSKLEFRTAYNPTSMQKSSNPPFLPSQLGPPRTLRYWWHFSAPPPIPHICCSFFFFFLIWHFGVWQREDKVGERIERFFFWGGRDDIKSQDVEERVRIKKVTEAMEINMTKMKGKGKKKRNLQQNKNTQQKTLWLASAWSGCNWFIPQQKRVMLDSRGTKNSQL